MTRDDEANEIIEKCIAVILNAPILTTQLDKISSKA
jgi:putative cell wall-binding protein